MNCAYRLTIMLTVGLFVLTLLVGAEASAYVVPQDDMMVTCGPSPHLGVSCRWQLRLKNDSTLYTWMATKIWPLYLVLSGILATELLVSTSIEEQWDLDQIDQAMPL